MSWEKYLECRLKCIKRAKIYVLNPFATVADIEVKIGNCIIECLEDEDC